MEKLAIAAEKRSRAGKGYLRELRQQGFVPGVVYGKDSGNQSIKIDVKQLKNLFSHGGKHALLTLMIRSSNGEEDFNVMVKDVTMEPIKGEILHVDLQQVSLENKIHAKVVIQLVGNPAGVQAGGVIQHGAREIEVQCLPTDIPEAIKVDISNLDVGDSIYVKDIEQPANIEIFSDQNTLLASIVQPRMAKEESEEVKAEASPKAEDKVSTVDTDEA